MMSKSYQQSTGTVPSFAAVNGGAPLNSKPFLVPLTVPPGHACFRLLCHASRVGGIIGRSGSIIRQLQQQTSAKIRVEDSLPGSDDHRVIVIVARAAIIKRINLNAAKRTAGEVAHARDSSGGGDDDEVIVSAAQEAVVRVFERVVEVAAEIDGVAIAGGGLVSCRLLAKSSQVGSVIGKGGKVVQKIREDTGCRIKVLYSEKHSSDEMVEIEGDIMAVKRALVAVTRCLQDCLPSVDKGRMMTCPPFEAVPQETVPDLRMELPSQRLPLPQATETSSSSYSSGEYPLQMESDRISVVESKPPLHEVVFRILCSNDRVGSVIGQGRSIVKALQVDSNAFISVGATIPDCEERLITVTAMENPDSPQSQAQSAIILVFNRFTDSGSQRRLDSGAELSPVSARLVVQSNEVGCLLGKRGTIVSEMRKVTGTAIRIFGVGQIPRCVLDNNEVVQITGEFVNVQNALYRVTSRLRNNLFSTKMLNCTGTGPFGRVRDQSLPGFVQSAGVSNNLNQHDTVTRSMNNLSISENVNHPPSPSVWSLQTENLVDGRGSIAGNGGVEIGSESRSAMLLHATIEIVVPENVIGSVYGDNGSNLVRMREISGAKVVVHEPRPGTTDRIVVISGSPNETQAAHSLLIAFITGSS